MIVRIPETGPHLPGDPREGGALAEAVTSRPAPVFGCGLSRTGNTSLAQALNLLGYTTVKFPQTVECMGADFDAAVDITVAAWMEDFDRRFPDAKWILTVRDETAWIASCRGYFQRRIEQMHRPESVAFMRWARKSVYGSADFDEEGWLRACREHPGRVQAMLADRPDNLLVIDITQTSSWDALCAFLGLPAPSVPFPHLNQWRRAPVPANR